MHAKSPRSESPGHENHEEEASNEINEGHEDYDEDASDHFREFQRHIK
jgi:hypothetical protein